MPSGVDASDAPPPGLGTRVTGFGGAVSCTARVVTHESLERAARGAELIRGLGRSYGDASLPARPGARVASSLRADRVLRFDAQGAVLRAEAGVRLRDLNKIALRAGLFPPVTPGTEEVTLGGMVAADVHGKNHHRAGSLGEYVRALRVQLADGRVLECGPAHEAELFWAVVGGMGLVAHVLEAEIALERVPSPWIEQQVERAPDLPSLLGRLRAASLRWPFTVAFADCFAPGSRFGRGLVVSGRFAPEETAQRAAAPRAPRRLTLPLRLPEWVACRPVGRLGYALYLSLPRPEQALVDPRSFFYWLDWVRGWPRFYGRRGFVQHQCVLPASGDPVRDADAVARLLERLRALGIPVFVCVIKDFGREGAGLLSFPRPGFTLALDLPHRGPPTQRAIDALSEGVLEAGGRIYLAKDALTRPHHFRAMEPRLPRFLEVKRKWDPEGRLRSRLGARLLELPA
jgi:FAD/FMN-containing dehydrogenase